MKMAAYLDLTLFAAVEIVAATDGPAAWEELWTTELVDAAGVWEVDVGTAGVDLHTKYQPRSDAVYDVDTYSAGTKSLVASTAINVVVDPAGIVSIPFPALEGPKPAPPVDVGTTELTVGVTSTPPA